MIAHMSVVGNVDWNMNYKEFRKFELIVHILTAGNVYGRELISVIHISSI